jgi:nucleoid-associated protein YgaU
MRLLNPPPSNLPAQAPRLPVAPTLPRRATAVTTPVQPFAATHEPGLLDRAVNWAKGLFSSVKSRPVRLVSGPSDPFGGGAPTVTVQSGDSLGAIARDNLGDAGRWREIFDANRDQISDPNMIFPGQVLKLPGVQAAASRKRQTAQRSVPATLGRGGLGLLAWGAKTLENQ